MYILGSKHVERLNAFGKLLCNNTIKQKRQFILLIIKLFGEYNIKKIKLSFIETYLLNDKTHSGSWKNSFLETFCSIYDETVWNCTEYIPKPTFQRFIRNSIKADIFTTTELNLFFNPKIWNKRRDFLLFLLCISCGLRIGEARGVKVKQLVFEKNFLVIDGFCRNNGERTTYNKLGNQENTKLRVAPIPIVTMKQLKEYISYSFLKETDYLFTNNGNPIRKEYLEKVFKQALIKSGIKTENRKLVPHSLRFTYVTRMRRNLEVDSVQKIVGHTSVKMTEYYTRICIPEMIDSLKETQEAANKLFI